MIRQKTVLELKMNERIYSLECDPTSPLGELFDVLSQMMGFVMDKMKEVNTPKEEKSDG